MSPSGQGTKPHVVVLGGGLAGMAAACHLLDGGYRITLVERRPFLGGRAFSFFYPFEGTDTRGASPKDAAPPSTRPGGPQVTATHSGEVVAVAAPDTTGCQVDNGQHVFLGCCTYFIEFLKKLGTYHKTHLQPTLRVKVMSPAKAGKKSKVGMLSSAPLPAPFNMLPSFLRYPHLGFKDKLLALYGMTRVLFTDRRDPRLEDLSLYQWLKGHGQTDRAIEKFWDLITLPTLNDHVNDVSAAMGLMVYQEGVLKDRRGANVGYSLVGLSNLMGEAARDYILERGGQILLGKRIVRLIPRAPEVHGGPGGNGSSQPPDQAHPPLEGVELAGGEVVRGDVYVSALPFHLLASVIPPEWLREPSFKGATELTTSPIVNVHVWYDRPVMDGSGEPFVAVVDSPLQWVFDKGSILASDGATGPAAGGGPGHYITISISGAWEYINRPKEEIRAIFLKAMAEAFPKAGEAQVKQLLVVKSQATFRCTPGASRLRPPTETSISNLFLAGDWTDTGWPSTMEGAVHSGVTAAEAIVSKGWGE